MVLAACAPSTPVAPVEEPAVSGAQETPPPPEATTEPSDAAAKSAAPSSDTVDGDFPQFATTDLYGTEYDNTSLFGGHDLTMINFWGTFCGPCIREMPDLGDLSRDMPEDTQLVGVVTDVSDESTFELAKQITDETGADYPNLLLDEGLLEYARNVTAVPTTIFVDGDGNIVGEPYVGSADADTYRAEVESRLQQAA